MDDATAAREVERQLNDVRRFWRARRDRVFLAASQAALDKHAGVRLSVPDAYSLLLPGDEIYQDDFDTIQAEISRILNGWSHQPEPVFLATQKFIDERSPGVYIIALTPETRPVQVKVGRTTDLHGRVLPPYRRICPTLRLLQHIPQTQFSGTLRAVEGDLIRQGKDHLMYLAGEVFHAPRLAEAEMFAEEMRHHFIGS